MARKRKSNTNQIREATAKAEHEAYKARLGDGVRERVNVFRPKNVYRRTKKHRKDDNE